MTDLIKGQYAFYSSAFIFGGSPSFLCFTVFKPCGATRYYYDKFRILNEYYTTIYRFAFMFDTAKVLSGHFYRLDYTT